MMLPISFEDVTSAAAQLAGIVHRTPILTSHLFNELTGYEVYFKCENFQRMGAFKIRGAYNALSRLNEAERQRGVLAYSSGNHAQGVALAAKLLGIKATIVMPHDSSSNKLAATRAQGAEVILYDRQTQDRAQLSAQLAQEHGYVLIPPYDHPHIMAGQGTVALELLTDVPDLEVLVVPVGGGGLLSGCATVAHALKPTMPVYGVETETANDWWLSFQQNQRVKIPPTNTIADGMRTQEPGELTYPVVREKVRDILLVTDNQVMEVMRFLLTRLKILAEPTGAVAPAAVMQRLVGRPGLKVGVIISGGNVDEAVLAEVLGGAIFS